MHHKNIKINIIVNRAIVHIAMLLTKFKINYIFIHQYQSLNYITIRKFMATNYKMPNVFQL